jgi:hypothetical protein
MFRQRLTLPATVSDRASRAATVNVAPVERDALIPYMLLGVLSLIRVFCVFLYRFDSDEPQHLHVAWGWANGLRPYRDVFDNHLPLFHIVTAPLFRALPQSEQILTAARLAMLPFGFATIALTALIGWQLAGRRGLVWAAVLASACPPLVLKTVEFRNDTLWCVLVLAAIALILAKPSHLRSFAIGIVTALALLTSVKTGVIGLAALLALITERCRRGGAVTRGELVSLSCAAGGFMLPLFVAVLWFVRAGLFADFLFGAFGFNFLLSVDPVRRVAGLMALPSLVVLTWRCARVLDGRSRSFRILALVVAYFIVVLVCVWPLIAPRDFLPIFPLIAAIAAAWMSESGRRVDWLPVLAIAGMVGMLFRGDLLQRRPVERQQVIADVLRLTSPSDFVMDPKGDAVFRRRPFHVTLDVVGRDLLRRGVIEDTIATDMIGSGTCVAVRAPGAFPPDASRFLDDNFVDLGSVSVCGKRLRAPARKPVKFSLAIGARYGLKDLVPGALLDGTPFTEPRRLDAGAHTFQADTSGEVTILWANAIESGS